MKTLLSRSLTLKVLIWSLLGFLVNIHFLVIFSEQQLEDAMAEQVTKQAQSFLLGLALQLEMMPATASMEELRQILLAGMSADRNEFLNFTPNEIYLYGPDGTVLAHTEPGPHPRKNMDGVYGQVVREGKPHIADEFHLTSDPTETEPKIDVIVPVHMAGLEGHAGLEAELNLAEMVELIQASDNEYEKRILWLTTGTGLSLFVFIWLLLHHVAIRHVNRFAAAARAFGAGDLEQRIPLPLPDDEVGDLGRSINSMADNISRLMQEQDESYLQTLQSLSKALEAKDAYTQSHSARVSKYSVMLGRHLGLPKEKLDLLRKGALMHDLGKIGIPDAILNKPSALTDEEFAIMRSHAKNTATIMRPLRRFHEFLEIAAWHHERWDGQGYPDGLAGEQIPLLARIVSIADTWDAMTGDRVYRKGMPREKALAILDREWNSGQWDPHLVQQFMAMIRQEEQDPSLPTKG